MLEQDDVLLTIALMAIVVYLTRAGGYFIGLQLRHISVLKPILEALPGCAIMAILVPAMLEGDLVDTVSMLCVVGLMWRTDNVVLATMAGIAILLFGAQVMDSALAMMPVS